MEKDFAPDVDRDKCTGCGLCVSVCPGGVLVLVDGTATIVRVESCLWCTQCEAVCPTGAVSCPMEIVVGIETGSKSNLE